MKINRSSFLTTLESVRAGVTLKDVVEQSSCFAFQDGMVMTYSDEIACMRKSPLKINGAVPAAPLMAILGKYREEFVEINLDGSYLVILGKNRRSKIRTQAEVVLPIEKVEKAEDWKPLHEDFLDAVYITQKCIDKDESNYAGSCIHITSKFMEACDGTQALRYKIKTGISEPIMVRGSSLVHIVDLGMTEFSETPSWIHFRNPENKLMFACRRDTQPYESLEDVLAAEGDPLILPKGLADAAEAAEVFSAENKDENEVKVQINAKRIRITGDGISGSHTELKKSKYHGPPITFSVGPKLLSELVKRYNDCFISPDRLKVDAGKFVYVMALGTPEKENGTDVETN